MSAPSQDSAPAATYTNKEGTQIISDWLNQRLRITITDSRCFEGWFKCIDRDCNIVLSNTDEFRDGPPFLNLTNLQTNNGSSG